MHKGSKACFLMLAFFLEMTCPRLMILLLGSCHFPRLSVFFFFFFVDGKLRV